MLIESITNVEGKFKNISEMSGCLSRIFKDKSKCILGLTKYKICNDYIQIKDIEDK